MNQSFSYKGYTADTEFSLEDNCFIGHISGIKDILGFHGETMSELQLAFEEAVDDYLEVCDRLQESPQPRRVM
ncbi:MAG: type II toxin-antitoxin system HicB family antitoxin [Spirulinaceae cyanobacterium]